VAEVLGPPVKNGRVSKVIYFPKAERILIPPIYLITDEPYIGIL
jgi:hypothetical protein